LAIIGRSSGYKQLYIDKSPSLLEDKYPSGGSKGGNNDKAGVGNEPWTGAGMVEVLSYNNGVSSSKNNYT
jgi:hypothetical protein